MNKKKRIKALEARLNNIEAFLKDITIEIDDKVRRADPILISNGNIKFLEMDIKKCQN